MPPFVLQNIRNGKYIAPSKSHSAYVPYTDLAEHYLTLSEATKAQNPLDETIIDLQKRNP